ncbi:polyketide synthase [Saccharopolyspora spinosa]|uniref:Ketoacyl-synthetase-like protein n=1 Tax=Saccharopolyspora spinosa TaxID=60894 RepID=A0A2N3Y5D9_SACSN|nr:polyketide synthase [Saccharopolyspora spinosa]PKW18137.1 ketoacyl-synthetase-like protein [Saccharopolyspora spinosa]
MSPDGVRRQAPVAVIGMSARVPGADDADEFWDLFACGKRTMSHPPAGRLDDYRADIGDIEEPTVSFFSDVVGFEPALFGITYRMAVWMDPQQRLMLEAAWQALESAGIPPRSLAGEDVGVFVSTTCSDMRDRMAFRHVVDRYSAVGLLLTFVSARISHHFDLRGPSITLDTACAGGLTALSQAVSGLRAGEFRMALVGSPNVYLHGHMQAVMQRFGAVTPSGEARCFSADADGYVRGEGVFCFVVKLLDDAIADGDPVLAIVRGSSVNHDGRRGGLTRSDPESQRELINRALTQAGLTPNDLGYVECHAAGTPKGDPIEVQALRDLTRASSSTAAGPDGKLWLGSAKANIGHLEGGAGSASLAKAIQILRYRTIPMTPGVSDLHRDVPVDRHPVEIATTTLSWPDGKPRRVGVTALGVGGANAHAVLEEAPLFPSLAVSRKARWTIPVSARTTKSLTRLVDKLASFIQHGHRTPNDTTGLPAPDFAAAVWTLCVGREQLDSRIIITAHDSDEFVEAAQAFVQEKDHPLLHTGSAGENQTRLRDVGMPAAEIDSAERWLAGDTVDWSVFWPVDQRPRRVALVPYPFDRRACWPEVAGPLGKSSEDDQTNLEHS